jgi:hypothetical protein
MARKGCPADLITCAAPRVVYAAADYRFEPAGVMLAKHAGAHQHIRLFGRMSMWGTADIGCHHRETGQHVIAALGAA